MKNNRKQKQKGREFLRRDNLEHAPKRGAFETDVDHFDNMQKERGEGWYKG